MISQLSSIFSAVTAATPKEAASEYVIRQAAGLPFSQYSDFPLNTTVKNYSGLRSASHGRKKRAGSGRHSQWHKTHNHPVTKSISLELISFTSHTLVQPQQRSGLVAWLPGSADQTDDIISKRHSFWKENTGALQGTIPYQDHQRRYIVVIVADIAHLTLYQKFRPSNSFSLDVYIQLMRVE
ncbi:hypothetical protein CDAR_505581 [Caerostris darwini]|uniref:Uncharacterized protein n=1 Tax=Caerostris darwini TaxID=1538125 RepID=A0AAV4PQT4_9ARAC|nr:hypothetical protein CDAR_505581 [Caerostris darwini]